MKSGPDSDTGRKSILIVDDHHVVRHGLTALLSQQPDFTVCAAVGSAEQALEVAQREHIDLAIVDISLGTMDGIALTGILKQRHPDLIVLILSMHDEHCYGPRALRAGASGFVAKHQAPDILLEAIHQVLDGRPYYRTCA
jgi:DNA-binding NarL/FixJ family response regulator